MNPTRRAEFPDPDDLHRYLEEVVGRQVLLAGVRRLGVAVSGGKGDHIGEAPPVRLRTNMP